MLEKDLDENTTARGRLFFVQMDDRQTVPAKGVDANHVAKEHGNVPQLVVLISMNCVVVLGKSLLEEVAPEAVDLGKALGNETKELCVGLFLGTTFDNHRRQLWLLANGKVDLHELVDSFLGIGAGHDGEVNCPS